VPRGRRARSRAGTPRYHLACRPAGVAGSRGLRLRLGDRSLAGCDGPDPPGSTWAPGLAPVLPGARRWWPGHRL